MLEFRQVSADWYIWIDSSLRIITQTLVDDVIAIAGQNPICLFRHHERNSIREEVDYCSRKILEGNSYFINRYAGEPMLGQLQSYCSDSQFRDDALFAMGFFAYHVSAASLMQEWFMHNILWSIQDQVSFPYVLKKSGLGYSLIPGTISSNSLVEWKVSDRDALSPL